MIFKTVAGLTGWIRVLLTLCLIGWSGWWVWQGASWAWFWAALLVVPGMLTFGHAVIMQRCSQGLFGRDYRSEAYWRSVRSGLWLSGIGAIAVAVYLMAWT